ncbi:hypothetical protein Tco_0875688 [Tanacetum coccineum]|uniref:Uncharacterized protein n=1 Tax=Tanacetum coccineum TaxID=301880 RepID=A0ABQ5BT00_9ASTR
MEDKKESEFQWPERKTIGFDKTESLNKVAMCLSAYWYQLIMLSKKLPNKEAIVVSNSTAGYVNTAASRPTMNGVKPSSNVFHKAHSLLRRPFNQKSAVKTNNFNEKAYTAKFNNVTTAGPEVVVSTAEGKRENVVKSSACWILRPTGKVIDHISKDSGSYMPKRFDYVDPKGRLNETECLVLSPDFKLLDERQVLL